MKFLRFILVLAVVFCGPAGSRAEVADGIKAVVNDRVITYAEVEDFAHDAANALRLQLASQPEEVFKQKLNVLLNDSLEQLVERQLILHSFDTEGYKLPESVIDELVLERIHEIGDRVTLMKTLQARGMTFEQFRKQIREQYITSALRNQNVQREVIVSPTKVLDYYQSHSDNFKIEDQVKLRLIVLNKGSADDTNALKFAREIQAKIKDGAGFAEMAAIYSQGSQSHQTAEWIEPGKLRPELAAAAAALAPGQPSDIIDTTDTIYLVLVEDKLAAHTKPLADIRNDIEKTLRVEQQSQLQKQWIDGLKKKTFIRYF